MTDSTAPGLVELPASHHGAIRLGDPRYAATPAAVFEQLRRAHGPVAPVLLHGDVPAWLVLGYSELHRVTHDTATFARSVTRWRLASQLPPDWPLWPVVGGGQAGDSLLYTEGETHRVRASAMAAALSSVHMGEFHARIEELADQLMASFAPAGEAELMHSYAQLLPVMALGWAWGVSPDTADELVGGFTAMLSGGPDAIAGQQRARDVITALIHATRARARPAATVAERLAAHPAGLTDSQIIEDLMVAIIAGHQTTAYWIGNGLRLMLTDDRFTNTLARGRRPVSEALREVLWEDTPTQIFAGRWTTRAMDLGSYRIPAGDLVLLGLAAANRDPHIRPDAGSGVRGSRAYLSYSHGPHGCPDPAQQLAETIATVGVEVLLDRLPDMTLACSPEQLSWQPGVWMRGLTALPVRFTPAPPTLGYTGGVPWT